MIFQQTAITLLRSCLNPRVHFPRPSTTLISPTVLVKRGAEIVRVTVRLSVPRPLAVSVRLGGWCLLLKLDHVSVLPCEALGPFGRRGGWRFGHSCPPSATHLARDRRYLPAHLRSIDENRPRTQSEWEQREPFSLDGAGFRKNAHNWRTKYPIAKVNT